MLDLDVVGVGDEGEHDDQVGSETGVGLERDVGTDMGVGKEDPCLCT